MRHCVTRWILPSVSKDHSAFIFRVKQINPEVEGIIILSNITNYLLNDTASHPRRMDFYFTGQEGNMHSALSHSLYFIHSSRNTYVTANGENVIPLLIFESVQNICKKSGTISESIALESHLPCATVCVR